MDSAPAALPSPSVLEGPNLKIETLKAEHFDELYASSHVDDRTKKLIWAGLQYGPFESADHMRKFFMEMKEKDKQKVLYATRFMKTGELIGILFFANLVPENREAGGGGWAIPKRHFAGTLWETTYITAKHVLDELGYLRYQSYTDSKNRTSMIANSRIGFRFEGVARQHLISKGKNRNTAFFSFVRDRTLQGKLPKDDWNTSKRKLFERRLKISKL